MKIFFSEHWQALCVAMQFLTQFPIRLRSYPDSQVQALSLLYYPLVGAVIGGILYVFSWLLNVQSLYLQASLVLITWVVLTGGLHLDGLADSADGWMGGLGDPERTLRIMKDPCSGAIGVLALILLLVLKWSALITLLETTTLLPILLAPIFARLGAIILLACTPYVRVQGIATSMVAAMPRQGIYVLGFLGAALLAWLSLVCLLAVVIVFWLTRKMMLARLKGTTGDTAGALIELLEVTLLTAASIILEV
ncbi:adenosylcobinamide-GDP ribazoletransferase [Neptunomonas japonica]|uniref:Adenosylcobinamide-GDP ribazoletransferase n=1 Tax=Neptunomonas japonica JAMM 1380 TaxID=1441457 RepID=A0A7R6PGI0_9GAMM|nr:adenosylcobinamide-GDP ribazoletransferase [Neptunomonas japonica]BBB29782.1 adenosylcobinamide-GDP ribazoletransferase [Neptunomonas japonica JAMM 1380]